MHPEHPMPEPARVRFVVELQPETPTRRWHAVVLDDHGRPAFESDSPLDLVRELARWAQPSGRPHGLR